MKRCVKLQSLVLLAGLVVFVLLSNACGERPKGDDQIDRRGDLREAFGRIQTLTDEIKQLRADLNEANALTQFLLETNEAPTAATKGLYRDRIVIRWTTSREWSPGNGTQKVDHAYAIFRFIRDAEGGYVLHGHRNGEIDQVSGEQGFFVDRGADLANGLDPTTRYYYRIYRYPKNAPEGTNWLVGNDGGRAGPNLGFAEGFLKAVP